MAKELDYTVLNGVWSADKQESCLAEVKNAVRDYTHEKQTFLSHVKKGRLNLILMNNIFATLIGKLERCRAMGLEGVNTNTLCMKKPVPEIFKEWYNQQKGWFVQEIEDIELKINGTKNPKLKGQTFKTFTDTLEGARGSPILTKEDYAIDLGEAWDAWQKAKKAKKAKATGPHHSSPYARPPQPRREYTPPNFYSHQYTQPPQPPPPRREYPEPPQAPPTYRDTSRGYAQRKREAEALYHLAVNTMKTPDADLYEIKTALKNMEKAIRLYTNPLENTTAYDLRMFHFKRVIKALEAMENAKEEGGFWMVRAWDRKMGKT